MMSKKAQSQIITTVLIILLVLAAIVIVWQVVSTTIRGGAEEVEEQSACLGLNVMIDSVTTGTPGSVSIKRNVGGPTNIDVSVIVNGNASNAVILSDLQELETDTASIAKLVSDDKIEIAPIVDGVQCNPIDSSIA